MPATTGTMALTSDLPTVNNATLTMNVSGTGLSGSQTFTANQSSAATFTVTSNATNANTASTIVARDASGNFTAGTITAALTGNASTATTLATGRTIAITGDLAYTSASFDGSGNVTGIGTLATVNANVGAFTNASITVNAKGLITAASSGAGSVFGTTTQVTYNNAGTMTGSANLTFDGTNLTCGGTISANSDERLKTNWRNLQSDFIEQLAKVRHGVYDRTDQKITQVGVSAQALQPVLEHAVLENENGQLSVAYGNAALVACIQLAQRVVALEAKLEQLSKDKL
jgi:hypothetical protein